PRHERGRWPTDGLALYSVPAHGVVSENSIDRNGRDLNGLPCGRPNDWSRNGTIRRYAAAREGPPARVPAPAVRWLGQPVPTRHHRLSESGESDPARASAGPTAALHRRPATTFGGSGPVARATPAARSHQPAVALVRSFVRS